MIDQIFDFLRSIAKYIFIAVIAALVLLLLLAFLRIGIGFWLWSTVETFAIVRLGLDTDEAQLVTVIGVTLITLLMPTIASLAWYFLLVKKQLQAAGLIVGGQTVIFLLVSTIGSGVCFDRQTGKSLCYYADTPDRGRIFSRTPGFDPKIGVEFKEYTKEVAATSQPIKVVSSKNNNTSSTNREMTTINFNSPIVLTLNDTAQNQFEMRIHGFRVNKPIVPYAIIILSLCNTGDTNSGSIENLKFLYTDTNTQGSLVWFFKSNELAAKECETIELDSDRGKSKSAHLVIDDLEQRRGNFYFQTNAGSIRPIDIPQS